MRQSQIQLALDSGSQRSGAGAAGQAAQCHRGGLGRLTRLRLDPRTRAYFTRRRTEGLSKREVTRCLQRYVARELYQLLVRLGVFPIKLSPV